MTALLSKVFLAVFSTALVKLNPLGAGIQGLISIDQLIKSALKSLGYSSFAALFVGLLTWLSVHDGEFIKNSTIAYGFSAFLMLLISALGKGMQGVEPAGLMAGSISANDVIVALKTAPAPVPAPAPAQATDPILPFSCPSCRQFTGKIVDPPEQFFR